MVFGEEVIGGVFSRYEGTRLVSERSPFQQIDVYQTATFGTVLALDGLLQTSEVDEFCYHEMLAHVPLLMHPDPRRVLIIGGGDGGTLRHVLMHRCVERAVMREIDERVTRICREHMPSIGGDAFGDPRAEVRFADGIAFVRETDERFDVVLVDSSDPVGPGEGLFTADFYRDVAARLAGDGLVAIQSGSPLFQQTEMHAAHAHLSAVFPDVKPYLGAVPIYPGVVWSFMVAGEHVTVEADLATRRARERGIEARYWSPEAHASAFGLPRLVQDVLRADGPPRPFGPSPGGA
jgi:spermidine synthase